MLSAPTASRSGQSEGRGVHRTIQDGLWIVGDHEQDQFLDGTFVIRWQLHWVVGWDPAADEYRATHADNYGHAGVWVCSARATATRPRAFRRAAELASAGPESAKLPA